MFYRSVAMTIIESNQWEKALRNNPDDDDGMECTPFRKLIMYMPECAKAVLDKCMCSSAEEITTDGEETDQAKISPDKHSGKEKRTKYLARFNFEFIDDLYFKNEWEDQKRVRTRGK
ncbi:TRPA1-like protein, partial [Mya arenaria]